MPVHLADIDRILRLQRLEGLRVELKGHASKPCIDSAVHTVCAFANDLANANGGYVVFGVEELDGVAVLPPRGIAVAEIDGAQRQISAAMHQIQPAYRPILEVVEYDGQRLIVLTCRPGDTRPYTAPDRGGGRAWYVRTGNLTAAAKDDTLRQLLEVSNRTPFDDRPCHEASLDDLSPALLREYLHHVGSSLLDDDADPIALFRRLNLIKRTNGHEVPLNVALLFFAYAPTRWFRGAQIDIVRMPQGAGGDVLEENRFVGPLSGMLRQALQHLRGTLPAQTVKHPDRAEATHIEAFPFAAVEEALVNAVHHRGYDVASPDPVVVKILPDQLTIASYPGPMPGLSEEDLAGGHPTPPPARNRRIRDFLRDFDLAEGRHTGLAKIRRAMQRNGSPPPSFRFDAARTWFEVTLPVHPAFISRAPALAQPLRLGRAAPASEVVGRDGLVEAVVRAAQHQSVLLVGPRGRGRSSLLNLLAARVPGPTMLLDMTGLTMSGLVAAVIAWADDQSAENNTARQIAGRVAEGATTLVDLLGDSAALTLLLDNVDSVGPDDEEAWREQEIFSADLVSALEQAPQLRLIGTLSEVSEMGAERWFKLAQVRPVPPLSLEATGELVGRWLRGLGIADTPALVAMLVEESAGIPNVLVHLLHTLHTEGDASPAAVEHALDTLLVQRGDPTGLRRRCERAQNLRTSPNHPAEGVLQKLITTGPRPRLELIAAAVSAGQPRLAVLEALTALLEQGWLVDVDGQIRFEHPLVAEAWRLTP